LPTQFRDALCRVKTCPLGSLTMQFLLYHLLFGEQFMWGIANVIRQLCKGSIASATGMLYDIRSLYSSLHIFIAIIWEIIV
jgi:hypothetical protein